MKHAEVPDLPKGGDTYNSLWANRRLCAFVFLSTIALTALALLVLPVRYLATGSVIIAEQEPGAGNTSNQWVQKIGDPADVESQLLVIRSPRVMRLVMAAPGVAYAVSQDCRQSAVFNFVSKCEKLKDDSALFIEYVQYRYSIAAAGRSRVINISYQSAIPEVAQTMANALISTFLEDQRSAGAKGREVATSWIWLELRKLDDELREGDAKIQAFRRTKGLMRGAIAPISSERLTSIGHQLSAAEAARADAAARLQEIKSAQSGGSISDAPSVLSSRSVADLKQQLTAISAQLASSAGALGPKHPALAALGREKALIEQRLASEVTSIATSIQKAYDANDALVKSLTKELDTIKTEVGLAASDEASIENMVRDTQAKRQQYAELYKRAGELETEQRVLLGSTRLVSLAELPNIPFFPKKIPFLAGGVIAGLIFAFGASFLKNNFTSRSPSQVVVRTAGGAPIQVASYNFDFAKSEPTSVLPVAARPEDPTSALSSVTGVPLLARLRQLSDEVPNSSVAAIVKQHCEIPLARALALARQDFEMQLMLRRVITGLGLDDRQGTTGVFVTASDRFEGATFTALALAQCIASAGRRVLAIECDFRNPGFEAALALKKSSGLLGVLRGNAATHDVVLRTNNPNLDVIPAGGIAFEDTDSLMRGVPPDLTSLATTYDVVVINGPLRMSRIGSQLAVDTVIFCCKCNHSVMGRALNALSEIKANGFAKVGLVLTMVQPNSGDHQKSLAGGVHASAV